MQEQEHEEEQEQEEPRIATTKPRPIITKLGEGFELKTHRTIRGIVNRLLDGLFLFKKRKGEMVAGSATFYCMLSFGPVLLLMISLTGYFIGDPTESKTYVMGLVESNVPGLAKWILDSVSKIIDGQLKNPGFNLINSVLLLYACLGVVSSLMFGLNTIAKKESRGGFLVEDLRSMVVGILVSAFIFSLLALSNKAFMMSLVDTDSETLNALTNFVIGGSFLPALLSLGFFTAFYKLAAPIPVRWRDSLTGAAAFVGCFMAGKSFYWVYLLYSKESMTQSYGNFYTLIIAVLWVYFLNCSFFYGAAVSYLKYQKKPAVMQAPKPVPVAIDRAA
jgi:membrane protein